MLTQLQELLDLEWKRHNNQLYTIRYTQSGHTAAFIVGLALFVTTQGLSQLGSYVYERLSPSWLHYTYVSSQHLVLWLVDWFKKLHCIKNKYSIMARIATDYGESPGESRQDDQLHRSNARDSPFCICIWSARTMPSKTDISFLSE